MDALGGAAGDEVLALVTERLDELTAVGERTWLERHGIPVEFWSRIEPR